MTFSRVRLPVRRENSAFTAACLQNQCNGARLRSKAVEETILKVNFKIRFFSSFRVHTAGPGMGGELSKREGVLLRLFQSKARSFCCFFSRFTQIYALITISLLDIVFKWRFMIFFFCFEGVLLAMRGCTCLLRGCSRTLKTPNSPPLGPGPGSRAKSCRNVRFSSDHPMFVSRFSTASVTIRWHQ